MQTKVSHTLPPALLSAVFLATGYPMDKNLRDQYYVPLCKGFISLPLLQQQLLTAYYSKTVTQHKLAEMYGISTKRCSQQLHKALHQLRKAANPFYIQTICKIHSL